MMDTTLVGTWLLVAATSITGQLALNGDTPEEDGVDTWLYGTSNHLFSELTPLAGLTLYIAPDATFTEVKTQAVALSWYDSEGVLDTQVTPFSGVLRTDDTRTYLHLATPITWARPRDTVRTVRVRYDDGDTIICDAITLLDGALVRTISVVTDELYLDRTILLYRR